MAGGGGGSSWSRGGRRGGPPTLPLTSVLHTALSAPDVPTCCTQLVYAPAVPTCCTRCTQLLCAPAVPTCCTHLLCRFGITRAHLEEDAGKIVYAGAGSLSGSEYSMVDYNRAGAWVWV